MTKALKTTAVVAGLVLALSVATTAAFADSTQTQKNNWRNGAIAGGAVALYGLHNHQNTTTLLGAAGGAYALSQYERKRHQQSRARDAARRARWHKRHHYAHHHHSH